MSRIHAWLIVHPRPCQGKVIGGECTEGCDQWRRFEVVADFKVPAGASIREAILRARIAALSKAREELARERS